MIYEIIQTYEDVVDGREVTYHIVSKGKVKDTVLEYKPLRIGDAEALLDMLYFVKKTDPEAEIKFPLVPVDPSAANSVKHAFEMGWFKVGGPNIITPEVGLHVLNCALNSRKEAQCLN